MVYSGNSQNSISKGNFTYLFGYNIKKSKNVEFENGYKEHLQWHKENKDTFAWYGWYVQTGERLGLFVDGVFGITNDMFDNRIKPTEDFEDFIKTTAPYVEPTFRKIYEFKSGFSTSSLLEQRAPTSSIEVYYINVVQGMEIYFEDLLSKLKDKNLNYKNMPPISVYKLISGGEHTEYMLMAHRDSFSYFDSGNSFKTISDLVLKSFEPEKAKGMLDKLSKTIKSIKSETWSYIPDLSLIP